MKRTLFFCFALFALACVACSAQEDHLARRWVYLSTNLLVEKNVADDLAILKRAAAVGYNGVLLTDFKFNILDRMDERYFRNARQVVDAARALKMTVAASCMNLGWSSGIHAHDPNLAEGIPVRDMRYVVQGDALVPEHDPQVSLPGGDFETVQDGKFKGWGWYDPCVFPDDTVAHGGRYSARLERVGELGPNGNGRVSTRVTVKPFHYYRLSAWAKTQDFARVGEVRLQALAGEKLRALTYPEMGLKPTQDWTLCRCVFNSLDFAQVNIYLGVWGGTTGTMWFDDVKLEECGPLNILRRDDTPLVVKAEDGTVYQEGADFQRVTDPDLGNFNQVHEVPVVKLTPTSRLKEGQVALVSFYHPGIIGSDDVMCCISEPKLYDILQDQVRRLNDLVKPDAFFMGHDEIRCMNWDPCCQRRGMTPGQLLADNARRCTKIIRDVAPKAEIAVWSDMFDPNHNAVEGPYYLVNGPLTGSWEGLDPSITIMNWYSEPAPRNNLFFAQRGHKQMLSGYYDRSPGDFYDAAWLAKTKDVPGIIGVMYTQWSSGYGNLEAWAQHVWDGQR
jgi:hypothetical protein